MGTKLFVGSLPYSVDDAQLADMFAAVGTVVSAKVIMDRDTNRSKGFGFVEMSTEEEAKAAVEKLHGSDVGGRSLTVNEARPQEERRPRGDFNGGGNRRGGFERRW